MKKLVCVILAAALLLPVLTACNFTTNFSDSNGTLAEQEKVERMFAALASRDLEAAEALLHPDVAAEQADALEQLQEYLDGRKLADMTQLNWKVTSTASLGGKTRQESATYQVVLEDDTAFYLTVCYLTQEQAEGFSTFQFVLGIV